MRKVNGENLTTKQLKESYFGNADGIPYNKIVPFIECDGFRFGMNLQGDAVIAFPIEINNPTETPDYCDLEDSQVYNLTVYDFISEFFGLYEMDLEDFTFYFWE